MRSRQDLYFDSPRFARPHRPLYSRDIEELPLELDPFFSSRESLAANPRKDFESRCPPCFSHNLSNMRLNLPLTIGFVGRSINDIVSERTSSSRKHGRR